MEILLVVNGSLDRETIARYSATLSVSDRGNPPLVTDLPLTIELGDVNDNCPELRLPNAFLMINRDLFAEHYRLQLIGSDADLNDNGKITFHCFSSPPFVHLHPNGTLIIDTQSKSIADESYFLLHIELRDRGRPTPCVTAATLRIFLGSNRTDWLDVLQRYQKTETQPSKSSPSDSTDKHRFDHSSSHWRFLFAATSFVKRQYYLPVIFLIGLIILLLCFVPYLCRRSSRLRNQRKLSRRSPPPPKIFTHDEDSPTHNYASLKCLQPLIAVAGSSSSPTSSSDSTLQTRTLNSTYTYTAIGTHEDLKPVDINDRQMHCSSNIELIMTTV